MLREARPVARGRLLVRRRGGVPHPGQDPQVPREHARGPLPVRPAVPPRHQVRPQRVQDALDRAHALPVRQWGVPGHPQVLYNVRRPLKDLSSEEFVLGVQSDKEISMTGSTPQKIPQNLGP